MPARPPGGSRSNIGITNGIGRIRCGAIVVASRLRSTADSHATATCPLVMYRTPPCASLLDQRLVPAARSCRSTSATDSPRLAASSATPAPVTPPPTTRTSTTVAGPQRREVLAAPRGVERRSGSGRGGHGRSQPSRPRSSSSRAASRPTPSSSRADTTTDVTMISNVERHHVEVAPAHRAVGMALRHTATEVAEPDQLGRADPMGEVREEQLGVDLENPAEQRLVGQPARDADHRGDQPGPGGTAASRARLDLLQERAELAGHQLEQQRLDVRNHPVERHPADTGTPGHVGQRRTTHSHRQHGRAYRRQHVRGDLTPRAGRPGVGRDRQSVTNGRHVSHCIAWPPHRHGRPGATPSRSCRAALDTCCATSSDRWSPAQPTPIEQAQLTPSRLSGGVRAQLVEVVGAEAVADDHETRARHAGGQAYADIVRRRHGDASEAADAVVLPADAGEVAAVLAICSARQRRGRAVGRRHERGRRTVVVAGPL